MEDSKLDYNLEKFDFSLHVSRAKKLGLYEVTDPNIFAAVTKPTPLPKPTGHKKGGSKRDHSKANTPKTPIVVAPPVTSEVGQPEPEVEEEDGTIIIIHRCKIKVLI